MSLQKRTDFAAQLHHSSRATIVDRFGVADFRRLFPNLCASFSLHPTDDLPAYQDIFAIISQSVSLEEAEKQFTPFIKSYEVLKENAVILGSKPNGTDYVKLVQISGNLFARFWTHPQDLDLLIEFDIVTDGNRPSPLTTTVYHFPSMIAMESTNPQNPSYICSQGEALLLASESGGLSVVFRAPTPTNTSLLSRTSRVFL